MTEQDLKQYAFAVIDICGCAIKGSSPDLESISSLNLDNLYYVSNKHMLSSIVGLVLQKHGLSQLWTIQGSGICRSKEWC